jgi:hypothetical protein
MLMPIIRRYHYIYIYIYIYTHTHNSRYVLYVSAGQLNVTSLYEFMNLNETLQVLAVN